MLEQVRGNALLVCDRAVCRVLLAYFDSKKAGTERDSWPNMEVHPGVIELRRSHSGFEHRFTKISSGAVSQAAGPGTNLAGQKNTRRETRSNSVTGSDVDISDAFVQANAESASRDLI